MAELPPAPWTQRTDLAQLVAALGADTMRWVGGAVRDTMLGMEVADVDAATVLMPEEVMRRLKSAGLKPIPTGIEHGTVTAVLPQGNVEITTLRHDVSTDGRRATIAFANDWREDAARRDFTINALYAHPVTLEISDYFGGLKDLETRHVRFIGDARQRIREDHLRILRYYRFQARFGSLLDGEAEEACAELAPMLKGLSRERVAMELLNLLRLPDPLGTVVRMYRRGVLQIVLPEVEPEGLATFETLLERERQADISPASLRRLAALLPAQKRVAEQVAARLRLSSVQKKRLISAALREEGTGDPRALAYRIGRDWAEDRILLQGGRIEPLRDWQIPVFPLKGGEVVARGVSAGPEVARILRECEDRWIEEAFPGRDRVEQFLEDALLR
ncbi:poly(A) polymerase [Altererythrobacter atlanticus]|uniref:CCA-adding enzyme n=1 Tax=Croceibacterium atlanticum TaxID=1267766 RepID=A0A0F7KTA7_9SPHN|nr:CCA tRNA nucleotidyltransferase [Croceibacterium atlanticum]AKH42030.1 CCA-adding enzyme [Croceibacterium atlanticum]MBB5733402.1 poly(A) polymerase [Croceibacterium atlanticum]